MPFHILPNHAAELARIYNKTLHTRVIEPVLLSRAKMAQQFFKELVSPTQFPRGTQKEGRGGQRRVAPPPGRPERAI